MYKIKEEGKLLERLIFEAKERALGCKRVFVAVSGGVDSSLIVTILCRAFGPENVFGLFRNIKSNHKHFEDVQKLQKVLGFKLIHIDANPMYEEFLRQCKEQFATLEEEWIDEDDEQAKESGWRNGYASLKSCFTTPMASFIAKVIDSGRGRIFGTGNAEEDGFLRYFDKRGDGAVDNNIASGLNKYEVRQMLIYCSSFYDGADIFRHIAAKIPSADLYGNGDDHNDEAELTEMAGNDGFDTDINYGDLNGPGNVAWAMDENLKRDVVVDADLWPVSRLSVKYSPDQVRLILFLRKKNKETKHKVEPIPGLSREQLIEEGLLH